MSRSLLLSSSRSSGSFARRALVSVVVCSSISVAAIAVTGCDFGVLRSTPSTEASTGISHEYDGIINKAFCQQKSPSFVDECVASRTRQIDLNGRITCAPYEFAYTDVCFDRIGAGGFITRECARVAYCGDVRSPASLMANSSEARERSWFVAVDKFAGQTSLVAQASQPTTIGNDINHVTVEAMAIGHGMSIASATRLRGAMMSGLEGNRTDLLNLGFSDRELTDFFARLDPSGGSFASYESAARKLDMPVEELQAFVSKVLGTVADSRWEIRNRAE